MPAQKLQTLNFKLLFVFLHLAIKIILRAAIIMLFSLLTKTAATAQVSIDETNLITRLSSLNTLNIADAGKYFTDRGYSLFSKSTFNPLLVGGVP